MVKILGISIGEKDKEKGGEPKACTHPILQRGIRLNPEKQEMEVYCKKCGQTVQEQ